MRERAESANAVMALARGTSQASTTCAPREKGGKKRSQKAARQSQRHRRCTTAAAADAEPAVAAAATDADKLGGHRSGSGVGPLRRGPTPWRVWRRARAGELTVLSRSRAPPPTSPGHWIARL